MFYIDEKPQKRDSARDVGVLRRLSPTNVYATSTMMDVYEDLCFSTPMLQRGFRFHLA